MHGELRRALCGSCGQRWDAPDEMHPEDPCPGCGRPATRPDVVWFGEIPYRMEAIFAELSRADLFVAIGTSGSVYPAAAFVDDAARAGARTLELNLEPSEVAYAFDETRQGPAGEIVPDWVAEMLGGTGRS
jgi:NAD-dependent protein deacetylases, SIR2 family